MPRDVYSTTLGISDLFLDTANYGAHTTASDGILGTLPVLTRPGATLSSRVAASLNSVMDMCYLNAESRKEYVDIAVNITLRPALLNGLHGRIFRIVGEKLFNSTQFASKLERAYHGMVDIYPNFFNLYSIAMTDNYYFPFSETRTS